MTPHFQSDDLVKLSKIAIFEAGEIAKKLKKELSISYKSKNQPVTNADLEINEFLRKYFSKITPEFGWLSEESIDNKSRYKSEPFWCLDPIDGTRSFINGKPEYTISLALIEQEKPIFGMILNPETKEFFFAKKNFGSFCNEKKIYVNKKSINNIDNIAISSSESKKLLEYDNFNIKKVVKMGSIAYKIALVAKGKIDLAISFTKKNDWDIAAAELIIKEAGGQIEEIDGRKIVFNSSDLRINSVIASNKTIIPEIKKKMLGK